MLRSHRFQRLASGLMLVTFIVGCTSWKNETAAGPEALVAKAPPPHVRVTWAGGSMELWRPRIANDSLVGWLSANDSTRQGGVPLDQIATLERKAGDAGRTVLLVGGLTALVVIATAVAVGSDDYIGGGGGGGGSDLPPAGTCPLVYSWDGTTWRLDSGTFGSAIAAGLARTDIDNLNYATPVGDTLRLRMATELRETDHVDRIAVLAVDHPAAVSVAPDVVGRLHTVGHLMSPVSAYEARGADVLDRVRAADGWSWESNPLNRDSAKAADVRDWVELTFPRPTGRDTARLVVDAANTAWGAMMLWQFVGYHGTATGAWYDSLAADRRLGGRIAGMMAREAHLRVLVEVGGRWQDQGSVGEAGPEVLKRQVVPLDLAGVTGDVVRVRLESAPSLWMIDAVGIDYAAPEDYDVRTLSVARAVMPDGRDVRLLLLEEDGEELVMTRGQSAMLEFVVPPVPEGSRRSYVLASHGWYQLDVSDSGQPQFALLERLLNEPLAASRVVTGSLVRAIALLNAASSMDEASAHILQR